MTLFVDRELELEKMEKDYKVSGSVLYIIYGRRRVGKTTLLQKFIEGKDAVYFVATEESEKLNLKQFQLVAYEKTGLNILRPENKLSWYDIFDVLSSKNEKIVIIIDEYQYLTIGNKAISSVMQKIWDEMLIKRDVMLILCGSIVSMMYAETLNYKSPLYGRRTAQINLKPLNFDNYSLFFKNKGIEEIVQFYSVTGGVPRYIEIFDREKSLKENIVEHILNKNSFLYEEPYFLLSKEFKEIGTYFSILKTISNGSHKLSEIAAKMGVGQNSLGYYLNVLSRMELLYRDIPVTENNPEKSKKGLYFLKNNFISFWFKFVYPNRSYLEIGNTRYVLKKIEDDFVEKHVSFVYEELCRDHAMKLASDGYFDDKILKIGRWWNKNAEIDMVGVNEESKPLLFGECKYTNKPVGFKTLFELFKKIENNFEISDPIFLIYSKSGFSNELLDYERKHRNVCLFNLFDPGIM